MSTIRAQRLLNNVLSGATNSTALQTALGIASTRSDWQQALSERGKARLLNNNSTGAAAAFQSAIALEEFVKSPVCLAELLQSPIGDAAFEQHGLLSLAASQTLMDYWFQSAPAIEKFRRDSAYARALMQSAYVGEQIAAVPLVSGSSLWRLPLARAINAPTNAIDLADNEVGTILVLHNAAFQSTQVYSLTTDDGVTSPVYVGAIAAGDVDSVQSVAYGAGLFVVVGNGGKIYTSPTGAAGSWTARTSGTGNNLHIVRYANGRFIVLGSGVALYSTNGTSWTAATGYSTTQPSRFLEHAGSGVWYATANGHGYIIKSTNNGATWTNTIRPTSDTSKILLLAVRGNELYCYYEYIPSDIYSAAAYSFDGGATWASTNASSPSQHAPHYTTYGTACVWGGVILIANAGSSNNSAYTLSMPPVWNYNSTVTEREYLGNSGSGLIQMGLRVIGGRLYAISANTTIRMSV